VTVNKATPSVTTWPTASSITYGQTLASSTLSAEPRLQRARLRLPRRRPLQARYGIAERDLTPTDATDYSTLTGTASVTVNKATPSVTTWPTPARSPTARRWHPRRYRAAHRLRQARRLHHADNQADVGAASQSVTFTPTDTTDYSTLTGTASVTVNKATPSVTTWRQPA